MSSAKYDRAVKAYSFLLEHSRCQAPFSVEEVMEATGWAKSTVQTYMFKQWRDVLQGPRGGPYTVKPEFQRMAQEDFLRLVTQKRRIYSTYDRARYTEVVTYEFLLPLTREDQLRDALDELFYADTILHRLEEIGLERVGHVLPREEDEGDTAYSERVCQLVGEMFVGYSTTHVSGRFRAGQLLDRSGAGDLLQTGRRYLVDETTAVVRFIIPVRQSRQVLEGQADDELPDQEMIEEELKRIRWLFFQLFVEAIARTIEGEDEIWLLEEFQDQRHLYVWERP